MTWPSTLRTTSTVLEAVEEYESVAYGNGFAWKPDARSKAEQRFIDVHGITPEREGLTLRVTTTIRVTVEP